MSNFKTNVKLICTLLILLFAPVAATQYQTFEARYTTELPKKYISYDSVVIFEGRMYIMDDNQLIQVQTLNQDEHGLFVYAPYGSCPNGHPYGGPEEGCSHWGCPCKN